MKEWRCQFRRLACTAALFNPLNHFERSNMLCDNFWGHLIHCALYHIQSLVMGNVNFLNAVLFQIFLHEFCTSHNATINESVPKWDLFDYSQYFTKLSDGDKKANSWTWGKDYTQSGFKLHSRFQSECVKSCYFSFALNN